MRERRTRAAQIALSARILAATQAEDGRRDHGIVTVENEKSLEVTAKALRACLCDASEGLKDKPSGIAHKDGEGAATGDERRPSRGEERSAVPPARRPARAAS